MASLVRSTSGSELLERPLLGALTTRMSDGSLQTQPVWFDTDGRYVRMNTMRGFRKERNMRADARVSLFIADPARAGRWIELRGLAELDEAGAPAHLDELARRYTGHERYFGGCVPSSLAVSERPVIARFVPTRIAIDMPAGRRAVSPRDVGVTVTVACAAPIASIPADHVDLLQRSLPAVIATTTSSGWPRAEPAWCDFDRSHVRVGDVWARVTRPETDRHVTVLVVDPADEARWVEVRGVAEFPDRIHPLRVVCDAVHRASREDPYAVAYS